jgi:hypothetical protein
MTAVRADRRRASKFRNEREVGPWARAYRGALGDGGCDAPVRFGFATRGAGGSATQSARAQAHEYLGGRRLGNSGGRAPGFDEDAFNAAV